jgi:aminoglycoside phosphotransferase (APT) family kinase protein
MALPTVDAAFVSRLVTAQFPQWRTLPVRRVNAGGWDNQTFHLGDHLAVRLPRNAAYAGQVEKEHRWLPTLAPLLPLEIPTPVALGEPTDGYPWKWSIYRWIEGETAAPERIGNLREFASTLGNFLISLRRIDPAQGPSPGPHNFYRGGPLETYDAETKRAIAILNGKIDREAATEIWEKALGTKWTRSPVWIHGDVSAGNLLLESGRLIAVIDFGMLAVGDPACDLAIAWVWFDRDSRQVFRVAIALDSDTWARGRAWALWKALIIAAGLSQTNAAEAARCWATIDHVLEGGIDA